MFNTTPKKRVIATILLTAVGLLIGSSVGLLQAGDAPVIQIAYATYPDFKDLQTFQSKTDLLAFGTVIGHGVEFKDRGLRGGSMENTDAEGAAMRMITLRVDSSHTPSRSKTMQNPRAEGIIHIAITDVGLNGISSDATLHDGDTVALMLESIDVSRSDLHGVTKVHLYGVVGGRQGVFRSNDKELWLQDADPFEESAKDPGVAPLIEVSRSDLIKAIAGNT